MQITPEITIEELVERVPAAVAILRKNDLVCIICGEPVWGTLEELARSKGLGDEAIASILREIHAET